MVRGTQRGADQRQVYWWWWYNVSPMQATDGVRGPEQHGVLGGLHAFLPRFQRTVWNWDGSRFHSSMALVLKALSELAFEAQARLTGRL